MITKATPSVKEKMIELEQLRNVDKERLLDLAMEFYDEAQSDGNEDLKAYASCVLGDACCKNQDFSNAFIYLSEGIQTVVMSEEYLITCRCLNELGIILRNQGHYISALEAFAHCIRVARPKKELFLFEAMACSNFASLCIEMDDYEDALQFYQRSIECFNNVEDKIQRYTYIICELSYIARVYIFMDNEMKATMTYREMEAYVSEYGILEDSIEVITIRMFYNYYIGNEIVENKYFSKALDLFYSCENYTVYVDEAYALFKYLLKKEMYEELERALDHYKSLEIYDDMVNQLIHTEEYYMKLYEATGRRQELLETTYRYVELLTKKTAEAKASFKKTLKLQMQVVQVRTEGLVDLAREEKDEVTQLATKNELITVFEQLFEIAKNQGKTIGVGIFNIDNFKEIEDKVGTAAMDEIFIDLGKLVREVESDKVVASRYSREEFIIMFNDMTDAAIVDIAKYLHHGVAELSKHHAVGKISISQGYINRVPYNENRTWDFFAVADECRFKVSKMGGNNAMLYHHHDDLQRDIKPLF